MAGVEFRFSIEVAKNKSTFFKKVLDFSLFFDIINFGLEREANLAGLCKGSTTDSDSVCEGSNPSPAAKKPQG